MNLRRWHRPLSLLLGLPLLWIAVTGTALGIATRIREARAPYRSPEAIGSNPHADLPPAERLAGLLGALERAGYPLADVTGIEFAPDSGASDRVRMRSGEVLFLSGPAPVVFASENSRDGILPLLTRLHRGKFLGTPGRFLFSATALASLALAISGIALVRKRKLLSAPGRGNAREWHHRLGALVVVPLVGLVVTGTVWNVSSELRSLPPDSKTLPAPTEVRWADALSAALAAHPGTKPAETHRVGARVLVVFDDSARVYVGGPAAADGSPSVEFRAPGTRAGWYERMYAWHSGRAFGSFGPWIYLAFATAIVAMGLLGIRIRFRTKRAIKA